MAKQSNKAKFIAGGITLLIILAFGAYSYVWFQIAEAAKTSYVTELSKLGNGAKITPPEVSGFPSNKIILYKEKEIINTDSGTLEINALKAQGSISADTPIKITTEELVLTSNLWGKAISFDRFYTLMRVKQDKVFFDDSALKQSNFEAKVTGSVDISNQDVAIPDLIVTLSNHEDFLNVLVDSGVIEKHIANIAGFAMAALMNKDQKVEIPIYEKDGMINLGPFPIMKLPTPQPQEPLKRQKPIIPEE